MSDTKSRSLVKSLIWRVIATLNAFLVAMLFIPSKSTSLKLAVLANITGLILYYIHERAWNKIKWGIIVKTEKRLNE